METAEQTLEALLSLQFVIASLSIVAIMTTIKRAVRKFNKALVHHPIVASLMTLGNVLLGFVVAIPHSWLHGDTYGKRVFTGIVAGFMSNFFYHLVLKRFAIFNPKDEDGGTNPPREAA